MADSVRIDSIDTLKHLRIALFKFQEAASTALSDAEGELHSTLNWLDNEQYSFWQGQIRKRHETLERAKEALRGKKIFKDSTGRTPSAVEEEKAVRIAQARLEEAETKFQNCKKYSRILQKEIQTYKGSVQRFATTVEADIPVAASSLDSMVATLEQYVALAPGDAGGSISGSGESAPPPPTSEPPPQDAAEPQPKQT